MRGHQADAFELRLREMQGPEGHPGGAAGLKLVHSVL